MDKTNLKSVLDKLIKEEHDEANNILHKWFVEQCSGIHSSLVIESDEEEEEVAEDEDEEIDENLSPISGVNTAGDDVDDQMKTPDELTGDDPSDPDNTEIGDEDLEDRVEGLEDELAALKAQIKTAFADGSEQETHSEQEPQFNFEDLEESFELEKVTDPHLEVAKTVGDDNEIVKTFDDSFLPDHPVNKRTGGKPIEIKSTNFTGNGLETPPTSKSAPLLKNMQKKADSNLEKVDPTGPKGALLNKGDLFPADSKSISIIDGRMKPIVEDTKEWHKDRKAWEKSSDRLDASEDDQNSVKVKHPSKGNVTAARWFPQRNEGWVDFNANKEEEKEVVESDSWTKSWDKDGKRSNEKIAKKPEEDDKEKTPPKKMVKTGFGSLVSEAQKKLPQQRNLSRNRE